MFFLSFGSVCQILYKNFKYAKISTVWVDVLICGKFIQVYLENLSQVIPFLSEVGERN